MKKLILIILMTMMSLTSFARDYQKDSSEPTYVVFWTNQNVTGNIAVYYNGNFAGYITKYYSRAPNCGAAGCVTVSVRGKGNTWSAVGEDGTEWYSERVTLKPGCNTVRLYKSTNSHSRSTYPNSKDSNTSSSSTKRGLTESEKKFIDETSSSIGKFAGTLLATTLIQGPGWDKYSHRLDLGLGCGYGYGGLGFKINWQSPLIFGLTTGLGLSGPKGKLCWNFGVQMWVTDHWNIELGLGSRYYKRYGDYVMGLIAATNYQYPINHWFGILGGIGFSLSTNSKPYPKMEFNLGIVIRLLSK